MQTRLGTALFREEWSESTQRDRRWSWREDRWAGWVHLLGSIIRVCGFMVLSMLQEIQFTHLILCTGTDGAFPGRFNMVVSHQSAVQSYEDFVGQVRQQKRALLTTTSLQSITCYCVCVCSGPSCRLNSGDWRRANRSGNGCWNHHWISRQEGAVSLWQPLTSGFVSLWWPLTSQTCHGWILLFCKIWKLLMRIRN